MLHFDPDATPLAGAPAIARYVQNEGQGRLIQSIKSHLASASFTRTMIGGRFWTLETLVATYLKQLRGAVKRPLPARAVVGRPVRYWGADDADDDARAVGRMRAALAEAGFTEVVFELEPIAAALRYAAGLDHEELILVADFGGGTSDFSLLRVGPKAGPRRRRRRSWRPAAWRSAATASTRASSMRWSPRRSDATPPTATRSAP